MKLRTFAALLVIALWGGAMLDSAAAAPSASGGVNLVLCVATSGGDASACVPPVVSGGSGGGGGGGGGGSYPSIPSPTVTFEGLAYPGSQIVLLRNGAVVATVPVGPDARFSTALSNVAVGLYTFGVYAIDSAGTRSALHTFSTTVTAGVNTGISGIFLPPTISLDKSSVKKGDPLTLLGFAPPSSNVTIEVNSDTQLFVRATSSAAGVWRTVLDTTSLALGDHSARAQAGNQTDISTFSDTVRFTVGTQNIAAKKSACGIQADLNKDCRVQLTDFSILSYWYKRPLTDDVKGKVDLNNDGKVDIVDFSILAYYWTG